MSKDVSYGIASTSKVVLFYVLFVFIVYSNPKKQKIF